MTFDDTISYATVSGAEVVDLPYGNKAYSMTVVLPPQGASLDAFASALTESQWETYISALQPRKAPLYMPKLKMSYERTLNPDLAALGMGVAFTDMADLSGITVPGGPSLSIAFVKQKAYVDINEEGTEAAAVTVTGIQVTSAPMPVRIDRPYLFAIRERLTGTILFVGKVNRMP
jgi:serpin B